MVCTSQINEKPESKKHKKTWGENTLKNPWDEPNQREQAKAKYQTKKLTRKISPQKAKKL